MRKVNMIEPYNGEYEVYSGEKVVIDHLSLAQLIALSELL